jgi:hypothetical protein
MRLEAVADQGVASSIAREEMHQTFNSLSGLAPRWSLRRLESEPQRDAPSSQLKDR